MYYYDMDMHLSKSNLSPLPLSLEGPLDLVSYDTYYDNKFVSVHHKNTCNCNLPIKRCLRFYQRYVILGRTFHSLSYNKRGSSNSYVVQYSSTSLVNDICFGEVIIFYQDQFNSYALVKQYSIKCLFSDYFKPSKYYKTICEPIDAFFFILVPAETYICLPVKNILKHCVVFQNDNCKSVIVTPISSYDEHD